MIILITLVTHEIQQLLKLVVTSFKTLKEQFAAFTTQKALHLFLGWNVENDNTRLLIIDEASFFPSNLELQNMCIGMAGGSGKHQLIQRHLNTHEHPSQIVVTAMSAVPAISCTDDTFILAVEEQNRGTLHAHVLPIWL
jgi:hypothetical protein